jgi:hypothetical protein
MGTFYQLRIIDECLWINGVNAMGDTSTWSLVCFIATVYTVDPTWTHLEADRVLAWCNDPNNTSWIFQIMRLLSRKHEMIWENKY